MEKRMHEPARGKTMQEMQYGLCARCGESTEVDELTWVDGQPLCQECHMAKE